MSVLFKSPSNNNVSIGGSNKGFPPGDVSNIIHTVNDSKVLIKWTDPEDTIVDEVVFVKWKGTILVRNNDHYPISIKDGDIVIDNTERNKYKDAWYEDNNLTNNITYYYRFFTYSDEKIYNDSGNLVFKDKPLSFAPILKDNTWEQIANASESGNIPSTWKIGDEIDITLSGKYNETVTMQIWDFNHFDKTDGTGKAGICFGMKNLMKNMQQMNSDGTNDGGWNECNMRKTVMNNVFNSMPIELRNVIKEVTTYANKGNSNLHQSCNDKVFLPGATEASVSSNTADGNQTKLPIFTNNTSKIKKLSNGNGVIEYWWIRTPSRYNNYYFLSVNKHGYYDDGIHDSNYNRGVCFCFNV